MKLRCLLASFLTIPLLGAFSQSFVNGQSADVVIGKPDFVTSSPGSPTTTNINGSLGLCVHAATGQLFVADTGNNRVLRFSSAAAAANGSAAEAVFGQPDATSSTANNGGRSATSLSDPRDVFVDSADRLWVADRGNDRVLRFDGATGTASLAVFTADQVLGQANFTVTGSGTTPATMNDPLDVWVDANGNLYVVEQSNNRVTRFDDAATLGDGAAATRIFGQPNAITSSSGTSSTKMKNPTSITVDAADRLWVADLNNQRVIWFDNASAVAADGPEATGVLGQTDFNTGVSGTSRTKFKDPIGVAVGPTGRLWVTEFINNRVTWFDAAASKPNGAPADGVLGQTSFETQTAKTTASGFSTPWGIFATATGKVWVADTANRRVLRFSPVTAVTPAPAVKVRGKSRITTSRSRLTLKGSATNAARVEVKVGKAGFKPAQGTASWIFKATLIPGKNKILVRAAGSTGAISAASKITVIRQ